MRTRWIGGALLAAAAAGPGLVLVMLASFARNGGVERGTVEGLPLILLFAMPFGFVVALLPSVATAAALARLGARRPALRHPLVWAVAGFVVGTVIGLAFLGLAAPGGEALALLNASSAFGIAAAPCALLARWRTRWDD